ncbi:uncharacterized protein DSM5745_00387 [Aspergillus mulundensis]|uniref:F-box domain-containing protein n=1 Tax=Aspergillus mulundensis TaxID=1810919 RepID=A0A3D8T3C7_9EURO|nr:hypothetical protein DSM5745_00387 [Aspergillus mulundensis]RDW93065.1 hypothetical protein DSM5745_00387 [Aspergillus mulundensis]
MLRNAKIFPQPTAKVKSRLENGHNPTDLFGRLPLETREEIAMIMCIRDFLNLRLVSRAMSAVFHDSHFWRSRFREAGDRWFIDTDAWHGGKGQDTDWRLLYHATSRFADRSETTSKVWEVVRWMKETIAAKKGLRLPPLDFSGRALQHYHGDSSAEGRRIERAQVLPNLTAIGVTFVTGNSTGKDSEWLMSEIVALELITNGPRSDTIILGCPRKKAKTLTSLGMQRKMAMYRNSGRRKYRKQPPECPFTGKVVRVMLEARGFMGFRIEYFVEKISSIGVWRKGDLGSLNEPQTFGIEDYDRCVFDMVLEDVLEVVATFEGQALVDLGIRGHRPLPVE